MIQALGRPNEDVCYLVFAGTRVVADNLPETVSKDVASKVVFPSLIVPRVKFEIAKLRLRKLHSTTS